MATKSKPGKYDCYKNAKPDEPMFVLLARDPSAPDLVREWVLERIILMANGLKPTSDMDMVAEAERCADAMVKWRKKNWKK